MMKLILDTLEQARLTATPSDAMALADAIAALHALADVMDALGYDAADAADAAIALADLHALREHVKVQPFDVTDAGDYVDVPQVTELTPGAFAEWLGELERLAE